MKRREFVAVLGGAAAWSIRVRAQQDVMPGIGFLGAGSRNEMAYLAAAFHRGLKELGFVEGQNLSVEYRWAENQYGRFPALAADLVNRQVAVIAATSNVNAWLAARAATATIPIVLQAGGDPVKLGLVASFSRPGNNLTGVVNVSGELTPKRLELLHELVPGATTIFVLSNRTNPSAESQLNEVVARAKDMQLDTHAVNASSGAPELDDAFAAMAARRARALLVIADAVFTNKREQIVALATRFAIPAIYSLREFPLAGGLISYGANLQDEFRKAGIYVGRILKSEKPSDLPIIQPTKFELVVNLRTARILGLTIPQSLLARADEVIE